MVRDFLEEFGGILFSDGDLFLNEGFGEGEGANWLTKETEAVGFFNSCLGDGPVWILDDVVGEFVDGSTDGVCDGFTVGCFDLREA